MTNKKGRLRNLELKSDNHVPPINISIAGSYIINMFTRELELFINTRDALNITFNSCMTQDSIEHEGYKPHVVKLIFSYQSKDNILYNIININSFAGIPTVIKFEYTTMKDLNNKVFLIGGYEWPFWTIDEYSMHLHRELPSIPFVSRFGETGIFKAVTENTRYSEPNKLGFSIIPKVGLRNNFNPLQIDKTDQSVFQEPYTNFNPFIVTPEIDNSKISIDQQCHSKILSLSSFWRNTNKIKSLYDQVDALEDTLLKNELHDAVKKVKNFHSDMTLQINKESDFNSDVQNKIRAATEVADMLGDVLHFNFDLTLHDVADQNINTDIFKEIAPNLKYIYFIFSSISALTSIIIYALHTNISGVPKSNNNLIDKNISKPNEDNYIDAAQKLTHNFHEEIEKLKNNSNKDVTQNIILTALKNYAKPIQTSFDIFSKKGYLSDNSIFNNIEEDDIKLILSGRKMLNDVQAIIDHMSHFDNLNTLGNNAQHYALYDQKEVILEDIGTIIQLTNYVELQTPSSTYEASINESDYLKYDDSLLILSISIITAGSLSAFYANQIFNIFSISHSYHEIPDIV